MEYISGNNVVPFRPREAALGGMSPEVDSFLREYSDDIAALPDDFRAEFTASLQDVRGKEGFDAHVLYDALQDYQRAIREGRSLAEASSKIGDETDLLPADERAEIVRHYSEQTLRKVQGYGGSKALETAIVRHPAGNGAMRALNGPVRPDAGELPSGVTRLPSARARVSRYRPPHPTDV
jgi:hypothetical protein